MKINTKIRAFTLTEIMVVIVLSAIVAGLAFSILEIVQKNLRSIEGNYVNQTQIQDLELALNIDFNNYNNTFWNSNEERLDFVSPIAAKEYTFTKDSIYSDLKTYALKTKSTTFYFEGKEVNSGPVDAVKLTFNKTAKLHRIFVFKHNDVTIHF